MAYIFHYLSSLKLYAKVLDMCVQILLLDIRFDLSRHGIIAMYFTSIIVSFSYWLVRKIMFFTERRDACYLMP